MMITTSPEFSALLRESLADAPPTVLQAGGLLEEALDPEGLHVAAVAHTQGAHVQSLWLVKLQSSLEPKFVWLRTPAGVFSATVKSQPVSDGMAFA